MSGIIGDNVGRSGGLVKAASAGATVDGRWTLLDTTTFGSDASTFDYEPTFMQSGYTYKLLKIAVFGLNPNDNAEEVYMRLKGAAAADGAISSFETTNYYQGQWQFDYGGTNHRSGDLATNIPMGWDNMNQKGTSNKWHYYEFYIVNGGMTASTSGSSDYARQIWWQGYMNSGADGAAQDIRGHTWGVYDVHGLQWYAASGNMDGGMICKTYYDNQLGSN